MSDLTYSEFVAFSASGISKASTVEALFQAAKSHKAAFDALNSTLEESPKIDWEEHKKNLKKEQDQFRAKGDTKNAARYDLLLAKANEEVSKEKLKVK